MAFSQGDVAGRDVFEPRGGNVPRCTPAQMCAMAWARSNFPHENGPNIVESRREGKSVIVIIDEGAKAQKFDSATEILETVRFDFRTEIQARRTFASLPPATGLLSPYSLIGGIDPDELAREMNFGGAPEEKFSPALPPAIKLG